MDLACLLAILTNRGPGIGSGSGSVLSGKVRDELDRLWAEEITAELGFPDYTSLVAALND